jgi:hypothetical protein
MPCTSDTLAYPCWCIGVRGIADRYCIKKRSIPTLAAFAGSRGHAVGSLSVEEDGEVATAYGRG